MLRAIRLITSAQTAHPSPSSPKDLIVDLHPSRPDYRGIMAAVLISMEADPTFAEISIAGGTVFKSDSPHTVLDDMFLISGFIPRVTPYETGIIKGIRFNGATGNWEKDELIQDERLVMCNLKGMARKYHQDFILCACTYKANLGHLYRERQRNSSLHWLQPRGRCQRLKARSRTCRGFGPAVRRRRRLPPRRSLQRAAGPRDCAGPQEAWPKGPTSGALFGLAGEV